MARETRHSPVSWRRRRRLPTAVCLVAAGAASVAVAAESWQRVCEAPAAMPEIDRVVAPVPSPGKWRGRGFGDKRKLDVEVEECGRKIVGMAGVRLKHVADKTVPLERDDDGRYKAEFAYTEGGMTAIVTWDLEAESDARVTGRMTIMGRADDVTFELLEARPATRLATCACDAVREVRDGIERTLVERERLPQSTLGADRATFWATDPQACRILPSDATAGLPTQASFEAVARAAWERERIHRERCCAVQRAHATGVGDTASYARWIDTAGQEQAADDIAALTAERDALDEWLAERCGD